MNIKNQTWCGYAIRFVEKDGDWWAVLKDVCDALGLQARHVAEQLREYQKRRDEFKKDNKTTQKECAGKTDTLKSDKKSSKKFNKYISSVRMKDANGRTHDYSIVSEKGIYRTLFHSRKKEAEDFQDWVCDVLVELRQASGLEDWEAFQMADKEHQKRTMADLKEKLHPENNHHYINANKFTNNAIRRMYGLDGVLKKDQMTPEMLIDRQPILEDAKELIILKKKYGLDFNVQEKLYERYPKKEGNQ